MITRSRSTLGTAGRTAEPTATIATMLSLALASSKRFMVHVLDRGVGQRLMTSDKSSADGTGDLLLAIFSRNDCCNSVNVLFNL